MYREDLDDMALSIGLAMSKVIRRLRGDEIGHASKIPSDEGHRAANEVQDICQNVLEMLNNMQYIPKEEAKDMMSSIKTAVIDLLINLETVSQLLDKHEAALHILRDKRIR